MKLTTNVKGQLAVSKVELRALELGYLPSRPLFDARYDLVLDNNKKLIRVQIKYADGLPSHSTGSVVVKLAYENRKNEVFTYQDSEIDALIVFIPKVDRLCFFPKNVFIGKRKLHIRLAPSKNRQIQGIIFAKDYYW